MLDKKTDWKKIRKEYVIGKDSYRALAEKYGVSRQRLGIVARKEKWSDERRRYREQINNKTLQQISTKVADKQIADEVQYFMTLQTAAQKGTEKALEIIDQLDQYTNSDGNIDPYVLRCLMAALKDAHSVLRAAYDVPTRVELANLDIARQRLEIERQKLNVADEEDKDTGIVIIPEREAVDE